MCGIAGFVGAGDALPVVVDMLSYLEYRGYDSAGVAFFDNAGAVHTVKAAGRIQNLIQKTILIKETTSCCIGHTRWATHGKPDDTNAHPHTSGRVTVVHNGIIENVATLKDDLIKKGYSFISQTDTEVCAALLDYHYSKEHNVLGAISATQDSICGSYAICALFEAHPDEIYAFRKDSPLAVASAEEGSFAVSDISALPSYTQFFVRLGEGETARITKDKIEFFDDKENLISKELCTFEGDSSREDAGAFSHYMQKEILEEPQSFMKTVEEILSSSDLNDGFLRSVSAVHIVACGSAYNAGACALYAFRSLSDTPVGVHIASEFRYFTPKLGKNDLVILVSQSGETADTLGALRLAKGLGLRTMAIVNTEESAMSFEADYVLHTRAGAEISVASTKAYLVQLAALYLVAIKLAFAKEELDLPESDKMIDMLKNDVYCALAKSLEMQRECQSLAKAISGKNDIFFIGRGRDYALSLEASLKVKEITYAHCEAYAAGELKHGSIALITEQVPVVAVVTASMTADKMISNIREVKARGAYVAVFVAEGIALPPDVCDTVIRVPEVCELFLPIVCAPLLQFTAYHMAVLGGRDPDRPRNLAKSVTVE